LNITSLDEIKNYKLAYEIIKNKVEAKKWEIKLEKYLIYHNLYL
jgi:hypothetical protein